jgi:NosR/NirI family transcriptional regulator, nitrous oxide reductase regulator
MLRVALLGGIVWLIHLQHARFIHSRPAHSWLDAQMTMHAPFFPTAARFGRAERHGGRELLDDAGRVIGFAIQTSPASDRFLGFSGPTNLLVLFDNDERILGAAIVSSGDTRDHVDLIARDQQFLMSLSGLTWDQAARADVDGVSGATLTSLSIIQGLRQRLGRQAGSLKFPDPLSIDDARRLFPIATSVQQDSAFPALWHVFEQRQRDTSSYEVGMILRTAPAADNLVGYQGPTESHIGIAPDGHIVGVMIGRSFDNDPYVGYARDDEYFRQLFTAYSLPQLAKLDLREAGVEGVSGATMTSMAVARGVVAAALEQEAAVHRQRDERSASSATRIRTTTTLAILAAGVLMSFTRLRGHRWFRLAFQVVLVVYLGLVNADLLSLAMWVGWAQSGIPWSNAVGLVVLTAAAVLLPITTKHNVYCSHLCPHGAVQQWFARRTRWHLSVPSWLKRGLLAIRPLLLAWVLFVAMTNAPYSLVDIEPFDAYSWRAAAWPTAFVAIAGLGASMFMPMAHCRYGCPTGAVLNYLRRHARSDQLGPADWFAVASVVTALGLSLYRASF